MNNVKLMKARSIAVKVLIYTVLIVTAITTIFPYAWMILASFKTGIEISTYPEQIFPKTPSFDAYVNAFRDLDLLTGIKNTLTLEIFSVTLPPLVSALGAFAFAKLELPCKRVLLLVLLSSMMIPYAALMLPQFQVWQSLNVVGTLYPLIIPTFFGGALMTFFFIQYMQGVPTELFEAAKIDGAGYLRQFFAIMLPMVKPALTAQIVFSFVGTWNDYFIPSIYLNVKEVKTLQLQLLSLQQQQNNLMDMNTVMAGSVLSSIPMLIVFISCQKFFVESLAISGIKG
ncbi:MAG: carbohydrate ABC transporter permease [Clostridiales bacterium]|nr:carbohydrate ABC transporter permease [Clostridiales bacterium]